MMGPAGRDEGRSADSGQGISDFGGVLAAYAQSIIADARRALADPDLSDARTVHEVRKALKRWRAWLRLLAGSLGDQADRVRSEARDLMRTLAGARDAQAALDALADLRKTVAQPNSPISPNSIATMQKRLSALRDAAEQTAFTPAMRELLLLYLEAAAQALARWPLADISFDAVAEGMTATYRRARKLIPDDWTAAAPEGMHDLRRRVVEHRHQMELLELPGPRRGEDRGRDIQRLRNQLGACQDLEILSQFTAPHQPLARWRAKLAPAIAARRRAHVKTAERLAGRLFAEKPKAFRGRVAALWKTRRPSRTP